MTTDSAQCHDHIFNENIEITNHRKDITIVLRRRLKLQFNFLTLKSLVSEKNKIKKNILLKEVRVLYIINDIYFYTFFFKNLYLFCYFLIKLF